VVGLSGVALIVEPLFALRHFVANHNALAGWITIGVAILAASLPWLIRFGVLSARTCIHIICGTVLVAGAGVCFSRGGFFTAPVMGSVFLPLSGVMLANRRSVFAWWAIATGVLSAIAVLARFELFGLTSVGSADCPQLLFSIACSAVMGLAYDHTRRELEREREMMQARLAKTQRVESLGFLAAGIAHDFNNLLAVIRSSASSLLADLPPAHPASHDAQAIDEAVDRGAAITSRLLTFSRQEQLAVRPFDVRKTVRDATVLFERAVSGANNSKKSKGETEIVVDLGPERELFALGDAREIEQALLNLVVNARDAMQAARHGTIRIGISSTDESAIISVEDTGPGIRASVLPHLFEPFFTTKARGAGTGLGLSTAYGAIKAMGGDLRASSTLDQGARFEIILTLGKSLIPTQVAPTTQAVRATPAQAVRATPAQAVRAQVAPAQVAQAAPAQVAQAAPAQVAPVSPVVPETEKERKPTMDGALISTVKRVAKKSPKPPPTRVGKVSVLVVDDQELVLRSTRRLLRSAGFDVITASSGESALELIASLGPDQSIDVLLTDIVMPKMSGVELATEVRTRTNPPMPIIYCSGHFDDPSVQDQITKGQARFLPKPFTRDTLVSTVQEALSKSTSQHMA
jgi:two-component system, cell cycle sensor histidine kinase and response regulator CckA